MDAALAQKLVNGLKEAGINFITYLPETRLSEILPILHADDSFKTVAVSSEAEGFTIAAGACLGGKQAALYTEGTGVCLLLQLADPGQTLRRTRTPSGFKCRRL
jgi:sulfopyruvate decarboxylase TPP-binding subunit